MKIIDFVFSEFSDRKDLHNKLFFNLSKGEYHISFNKKYNIQLQPKFVEKEINDKGIIYVFFNKSFFIELSKRSFLDNFTYKESVNIEYCSANPTGKIHLGNMRNLIVGNFITKSLLFFNQNVSSCFYVNNLGNQIEEIFENENSYIESKESLKKHNIKKELTADFFLDQIKEQINSCGALINTYIKESYIYEKYKNDSKFWSFISEFLEGNVFIYKNIQKYLFKKNSLPTYFLVDLMFLYHKKNLYEKIILVIGSDHNLHAEILKYVAYKKDINLVVKEINFLDMNQFQSFSKRKNNIVYFENLNIEEKKNFVFKILKSSSNSKIFLDKKSSYKETERFFNFLNLKICCESTEDITKLEKKLLLSFCSLEQTFTFFLFTLEPSHIIRSIEKINFLYSKINELSYSCGEFINTSIRKIKDYLNFVIINL